MSAAVRSRSASTIAITLIEMGEVVANVVAGDLRARDCRAFWFSHAKWQQARSPRSVWACGLRLRVASASSQSCPGQALAFTEPERTAWSSWGSATPLGSGPQQPRRDPSWQVFVEAQLARARG